MTLKRRRSGDQIERSSGDDGLPLSVQLVGRPGAEHTLYSLAGQIEAARPSVERRPSLTDHT